MPKAVLILRSKGDRKVVNLEVGVLRNCDGELSAPNTPIVASASWLEVIDSREGVTGLSTKCWVGWWVKCTISWLGLLCFRMNCAELRRYAQKLMFRCNVHAARSNTQIVSRNCSSLMSFKEWTALSTYFSISSKFSAVRCDNDLKSFWSLSSISQTAKQCFIKYKNNIMHRDSERGNARKIKD